MDTNTLDIVNLRCVRQQKPLFADISLRLHAGEVLLVEGPNGSGKSSFLRLVSGLATPTAGDILWQGTSIHTHPALFVNALHYISHSNGIKLGLTVAENLRLAHSLQQIQKNSAYEAVLSLLDLTRDQHTQARFLSAGQKRRLALARLFLLPKKIWILDEPFTALDTQSQSIFSEQLERHVANQGIALISTHHALSLANAKTLRLTSC